MADLGYGDAALAWLEDDGTLTVLADARPATAMDPFPASRGGDRCRRTRSPKPTKRWRSASPCSAPAGAAPSA